MPNPSDYIIGDNGLPLRCQYCDAVGKWRGGIGGPYQWVVCDWHYNDFNQQYMKGKRPGKWELHPAPAEADAKALADYESTVTNKESNQGRRDH